MRSDSPIVLAFLVTAIVFNGSPAMAGNVARVETTGGPVQGLVNATTISYLGIPYAEAPVGQLRWRPPEPKRPWKAVLDATHYRDHCPQFPMNKSLTGDQTG